MDRKTMGLLAGVAAVAACGCPGAFSVCLARRFALISYNLGAGSSARLSTEWSWSAISKNPKPTTRTARASQTNIVDEARTSRAYQ